MHRTVDGPAQTATGDDVVSSAAHSNRRRLLAAGAVALAVAAGAPQAPRARAADLPPGPVNAGFETGDLTGWTVVRGAAFGPAAVSAATTYWGGDFHQQGGHHLWGFAAAGDDATGVLRSQPFAPAADRMSSLVAGGHDPQRLYVALVRVSDG